MTPLLIDEPENAAETATTVLLAHGAGASMEHVGMQSLCDAFVARGMRVESLFQKSRSN